MMQLYVVNGAIQLTNEKIYAEGVGRASYSHPVRLWDSITNQVTSFTTEFTFQILQVNQSDFHGDGFAFFLSPFNNSTAFAGRGGENLGLVSSIDDLCVAVEFDTFNNTFDPNGVHLGIDVNNMTSVVTTH